MVIHLISRILETLFTLLLGKTYNMSVIPRSGLRLADDRLVLVKCLAVYRVDEFGYMFIGQLPCLIL